MIGHVVIKDILMTPDPNKFTVLEAQPCGNYTFAAVQYPNCTNFEGKKILIIESNYPKNILQKLTLDPHFLEGKNPKIVARFRPDMDGVMLLGLLEKAIIEDID